MNQENTRQILMALTEKYIEDIAKVSEIDDVSRAAATSLLVMTDYLEEFGYDMKDVAFMLEKTADYLRDEATE